MEQFGASNLYVPPPGVINFVTAEQITTMTADASGDVIVGGITTGTFPGYSYSMQAERGFVAKYGPTGNQLWINEFGTGDGDSIAGVAVDAAGEYLCDGHDPGSSPRSHESRGPD